MNFRRTPSGLQNTHLFKEVDIVVYTEGDNSEAFTKEDILNGKGGFNSDDIRYWKKLFIKYLPEAKVKFVAVGSCATLREIVKDIKCNSLSNICVVMDRDYHGFWGELIDHSSVIYTRGYSWENDLFNSEVIIRAFGKLSRDDFDRSNLISPIMQTIEHIKKEAKWFALADLIFVSARLSFFPRKGSVGWCFQQSQKPVLPKIDVSRLKTKLKSERCKIGSLKLIKKVSAFEAGKDMYGKPLFFAALHMVRWLLKNNDLPSIANEYLEKFLLDAYSEWLDHEHTSDEAEYYRESIGRLRLAA